MMDAKQWVCFIFQDRGTGRLGKLPVSPRTKRVIDKTDEAQWATFARAYGAYEVGDNVEGIGFVFDNGFIAIDLDDCFEENGTLTPSAQDVLDHFSGTYVEYSPSGEGLHLFVRGEKPNKRTKNTKAGIEVYDGKNFVTVTGDVTPDSGVEALEMQEELEWLFETYLPEQNVKGVDYTRILPDHGGKTVEEWLAIGLERDDKLNALYNSDDHTGDESSVDMALLSKLSFWLNRDADAVEDAFFASRWYDTKDAPHKAKCESRRDYIENSIANAVNRTVETATERDQKFLNRVKVKLRPSPSGGDSQTSLVDDRFLDDLTDAGTAQLLADVYGDVLCYTDEFGWCWYNGQVWEKENKTAAMRCVVEITGAILEEAQSWLDSVVEELIESDIAEGTKEWKRAVSEPTRLLKYVTGARRSSVLRSIMDIAATKMVRDIEAFDTDEYILNTPLCIIDLRTGERFAHSPEYMCTSITAVTPDPDRKTDLWAKTLIDTFSGDRDLIRYVQMHMGSALVGKVFQENLIIANGGGSNGKSTLFGAIQHVFGDYATSVDPELLLSNRPGDQQVGMAMLYGKRLAIAQETDEGKAINGAMLKRLVSTDTMVAKKLYHNPFNFVPTHTLVLSTNHLPRIKSNDTGTWRRIDVLPFAATITPDKMITDYMGMLIKDCGSEILQWCVDGAKMFYEAGCIIKDRPESVTAARSEYRENEDWLLQFTNDCVDDAPEAYVLHADLYNVYKAWCERTGSYKRSSILLSKSLKLAGWEGEDKAWIKELDKVAKVWHGKKLKEGIRYRNNIVKLRSVS